MMTRKTDSDLINDDWNICLGEYCNHELPRPVDPTRPQLILGRCPGDPSDYINRLNAGEEGSRSNFAVEHGIRARMDLFEALPSRLKRRANTHKQMSNRIKAIKKHFLTEGFVVDMNWGNKIYSVYVIDLELPEDLISSSGFVYVGQTVLTPEERFQQHIEGLNSSIAKRFGIVALNQALCNKYPKVRTRMEAEALEEQAANELEAKGWKVHWG